MVLVHTSVSRLSPSWGSVTLHMCSCHLPIREPDMQNFSVCVQIMMEQMQKKMGLQFRERRETIWMK